MSLETPDKIRSLQRKLYCKAKAEPAFAGARSGPVLPRICLRGIGRPMPSTRAQSVVAVGLAVKPVGKPDAGNPHVRFDERGWETGRCQRAQAYRAHPRLYRSRVRSGISWSIR